MRILYFTRDYTPHDHRFLTFLAGTEHKVHFLRLENRNHQLEDRPVPAEIKQIHWRGGKSPYRLRDILKLVPDLRRVNKEVQPDVIHAGPVPQAAFLVALSGYKPLVSMSWGSDLLLEAKQNLFINWMTRFALQRTSVLLGDCQAVKDEAKSLNFPEDRVVVFPWGVNLEKFSPGRNLEFRARRGWQDAFVLLSLRNWEPIYGVDMIVRAFSRAIHKVPQLRLILLGSGSQSKELLSILRRENLIDFIFLGGQVTNKDLPDYFQAADLYLSASHSDGSSVSLLESLASGLPVLVSDIPTNREWIEEGKQGWLFSDGNEDQLVDGILHAVQHQKDLASMGEASRKLAERRADEKTNFKKLLDAYQMAVTSHVK